MDHYLDGFRVLELADETGEYVGKVLAGLGADVVKVEGVGGEATRDIGPFRNDVADREESLFFWHYNHGKRSVVLDPETKVGQERFRALACRADVLIDTRQRLVRSFATASYRAAASSKSEVKDGLASRVL